jgi:Na+-transporting methylmalonyl-CoA/oxaloacetate decarboxylase gamma subunit
MRKAQVFAALTALAFFLVLGATAARAADETKEAPKCTPQKVEKNQTHHRFRGVITAVERDKDGNVLSFTVTRRRHRTDGTVVVREQKFTLDSSTRFAARDETKALDPSVLAKGERVRVRATGDHADRVFIKQLHTAGAKDAGPMPPVK